MKTRGRYVSTGHLPSPRQVQAAVDEAYRMYRPETGGENSQTYPALARVPGGLFGICVAGISGSVYRAGDTGHEFTIMSVAKPFVFALVCEAGVPGKSGIAGGIVAVSPGKGGLGTFSPLLDQAGNSVRGQLAARHLSRTLGLSLFASREPRPHRNSPSM